MKWARFPKLKFHKRGLQIHFCVIYYNYRERKLPVR
nr:MAG TPA: hypothetical protein [Caudoviricetes sp.]